MADYELHLAPSWGVVFWGPKRAISLVFRGRFWGVGNQKSHPLFLLSRRQGGAIFWHFKPPPRHAADFVLFLTPLFLRKFNFLGSLFRGGGLKLPPIKDAHFLAFFKNPLF